MAMAAKKAVDFFIKHPHLDLHHALSIRQFKYLNAYKSKSFTEAIVEFEQDDVHHNYAVRLQKIFEEGFVCLEKYRVNDIDNLSETQKESLQCLVNFFEEKDGHLECLAPFMLKAKGHTVNASETDKVSMEEKYTLLLAEHLFGPLTPGECYLFDRICFPKALKECPGGCQTKHLDTTKKVQLRNTGMANQSPVKYKTYVNNPSIPVPRTTQYRQRKRQQDTPRVEVSKFLRQYSETLSTTCDDCLDFDLGNEDPSTSFQSASAHVQQRVLNENANQIETQQLYEIIPDTSSNTLSLVEETLDNCHAKFKDNIEEGTDSLNGCNVQPEIDSLSLSSNSSLESDSSTECLDNNYDSSSTDSDLEDNVADNYDDKDKTSKLSEFDEKCMTLLSFVLKHHLSWQASIDFIELFGIFMTDKEITLDKIKQRVGATKPQIIDFCEHCYTLFPEDEGVVVCLQENCGGLRFKGHITRQSEKKNRKSYFACLPLKMQIQDILERDGVWDSICNYRKKCQEATSVTDILNGEMYKLISGPGNILESDNYITLLFNTDGVPLYKSSGISIWPVHLVINELPPKIRFSRKNMILWGVWQAKGKPNFQTFFQPFIAQMISLKNEGIQVKLNDTETQIRAVLLAGTLDLQAKAIVAKMTQHNGQHGCITCEEPGEVVKQGKGHCRVYPFRETFVTTRTSSGVLQNGLQAMANRNRKTTTKGIKDVSCLHGMDWFDLIYGLVPDYMHGALLGVTKQMLQLLFASSNSKKPFFIGNHIKEVDDILKKMQPTDNISRLPRHLEKNLHHLKASELELWLLYYSLPCLIDFLKPAYLNHLALMIEGIYILLGDNIDATKLNRAERVLSEFYHLFSDLYGYENCTLNLHNVGKHLIEYVRKLGPVWAWSCFPFEDMNGSILEYAHGTGDVFIQILWTIQAQKRLAIDAPSIRNDLLRNYVLKMVKAGRNVKAKFEAKNCRIAGGMKPLLLCQEMTENLKAALNISEDEEVGELSKALRIIIKDTIFFTKQYSRMKKRIAHTVLIRDNEVVIATIQYFIYHKNSKMCFAVVNKLEMNENPLLHPLVNHFICLKSEENQNEEMSIIPVDKIREKLLVLNGNKNYRCVCRLPNLYQLSHPDVWHGFADIYLETGVSVVVIADDESVNDSEEEGGECNLGDVSESEHVRKQEKTSLNYVAKSENRTLGSDDTIAQATSQTIVNAFIQKEKCLLIPTLCTSFGSIKVYMYDPQHDIFLMSPKDCALELFDFESQTFLSDINIIYLWMILNFGVFSELTEKAIEDAESYGLQSGFPKFVGNKFNIYRENLEYGVSNFPAEACERPAVMHIFIG